MKNFYLLLICLIFSLGSFCNSDTTEIETILAKCGQINNQNPLKAAEYARTAEALIDESTPLLFRLRVYREMGKDYARLNDVKNATYYLDKILKLLENREDHMYYKAEAYNSYSILNSGMGDFQKAIDYLLKAIDCFNKSKHAYPEWEIKQNLAICYAQTGNPDKALQYLKEAVLLSTNDLVKGEMYTNIGVVFDMKGQSDSSIHYYERAYAILSKEHNSQGLAMLLNNMAAVELKQKNVQKGLAYLEKSLKMMKETGDKKGIIMSLNNISEVLAENGKVNDALSYAKEAYELAVAGNLFHELKNNYDLQSSLYFKLNNPTNAYLFCRRYATLNDSLKNNESIKQIAEMETKYETTTKQKEIALLKKDNELHQVQNSKNKAIILFLVSGFIVLGALLFLIFRQYKEKKKVNLQLEHKNKIIEEKQKEILDSIHYARRIQNALITNEKYIDRSLTKLGKDRFS